MRLAPDVFWGMSLPEWRALLDGNLGTAAPGLTRGELDQLMREHPDGHGQ